MKKTIITGLLLMAILAGCGSKGLNLPKLEDIVTVSMTGMEKDQTWGMDNEADKEKIKASLEMVKAAKESNLKAEDMPKTANWISTTVYTLKDEKTYTVETYIKDDSTLVYVAEGKCVEVPIQY